jgi:hypothetical protein
MEVQLHTILTWRWVVNFTLPPCGHHRLPLWWYPQSGTLGGDEESPLSLLGIKFPIFSHQALCILTAQHWSGSHGTGNEAYVDFLDKHMPWCPRSQELRLFFNIHILAPQSWSSADVGLFFCFQYGYMQLEICQPSSPYAMAASG